jgi:hypothetical protein
VSAVVFMSSRESGKRELHPFRVPVATVSRRSILESSLRRSLRVRPRPTVDLPCFHHIAFTLRPHPVCIWHDRRRGRPCGASRPAGQAGAERVGQA